MLEFREVSYLIKKFGLDKCTFIRNHLTYKFFILLFPLDIVGTFNISINVQDGKNY